MLVCGFQLLQVLCQRLLDGLTFVDMGARIREVEQGPDGSIWLLEDGSGGRLLELQPK